MQIRPNYTLLHNVVKGHSNLADMDRYELVAVALCKPFSDIDAVVVRAAEGLCVERLKARLEMDWNRKLEIEIRDIVRELYPVTKIDQIDNGFHVQYKLSEDFWDWVYIETPHDAAAFVAEQRRGHVG
jgi:hypothetical protein